MPTPATFPIPHWVKPEDHQRFALTLAALYHNEAGSIAQLAVSLGMSTSAFSKALKKHGISARNCMALESLLGAEHFPREFFRPDLFHTR